MKPCPEDDVVQGTETVPETGRGWVWVKNRADSEGHTLMISASSRGGWHWSWYVPGDNGCPQLTGTLNSGRLSIWNLQAEARRLAEAACTHKPSTVADIPGVKCSPTPQILSTTCEVP